HIGHCFDYLRQAIMCSADTTLVGALPESAKSGVFEFDGWGFTHMCRNLEDFNSWVSQY
ncbi:hypothetical protein COCHEDRAFT_1091854, partial [Bipolaris maydis C5]